MVSVSNWAAAVAEVRSCVEAWNCDVEGPLPNRKFLEEKAARQSKLPSAYLRQLKQCMKNHLVNMK
ncbi:hypothetical protein MUK42_33314 [Musa troglodytarum]|uniref:Uncharacterized protein n=1 Tax=Musa troglodytarum TaxID=320322 RepID=A0A9E7F4U2_9LILI|nr:hypothetical protein MUK42_33314 [Musa troglodytarum]